jgi:integrase
MARRLRDSTLDSREARRKLKPRGEPYYRSVEKGIHLGYRRRDGAAGTWLIRHFNGTAYNADRLASADDLSDADGIAVLSYWQAVDAVRKRMAEQGRAITESVRRLSVVDVMDAYVALLESEGRSTHTIRDVRYRDHALIRPALGKLIVADLTADRLRRWRDDLVKAAPRLRTKDGEKQKHRRTAGGGEDATRARRSTANRTWTILRAALNHAFNDGKIASDHAWRKVKPFKKVDGARVRYLTVAEAKRLINACESDFRLLVRAALCTGCRYGELTRLVVSDFNPDVGTVGVRESKSGKPRHVVLTAEGRAFFAELTAGRSGDEVLLRKADGSAWQKSHQFRPMAEAVKRAKIKPKINFHGLRHSWASLSIMAGVPALVVARNLGHSDGRMVERFYGHLSPSYIADAIRAGAPQFGFRPDQKVAALGRRA